MRSPKHQISSTGWYVASYLHRFICIGDKKNTNPNAHFTVWENTILVKARTPHQAYKKAIRFGKLGIEPYTNTHQKKVRFIFEGLTSLLPVYDHIEDGAEIFWTEYRDLTLKRVRRRVKSKKELEVFQTPQPRPRQPQLRLTSGNTTLDRRAQA